MTLLQRILILSALLSLCAAPAQAAQCTQLAGLKFAHAAIVSAQSMAAGAPGATPGGNPLPASTVDYCRVQAISKPSPDSEIRFELWIPSGGGWNGKFEQVGNGGFAGSIPYPMMAHVLSLGYAVAGTDDGHQSRDSTDARWALRHPEKVKDYGWRAIDETAVASKLVIRRLTSRAPAKSYFVGCSDGGREALMMAQRFPTYFDGIVAGAPAFAMTRLLTSGALRSVELGGAVAHLSAAQLGLLQSQALQRCGNGAAYLQDPRACHIDLEALKCTGTETATCLSQTALDTARVIYAEHRDPASGATLYGVLPGAEAVKGSWDAWLTGTDEKTPAAALAFTWNYLAYMVMDDAQFDLAKVTHADLVRGERTFGPIIDSNSADLSAFKAHGGKLIQYHGWNDPGIAPGYSLEYRARLAAATGGLGDFYRLYMIPGMLHCGGGDAPTAVNWQEALEAWVEKSAAPGELTATGSNGATQTLRPFE